VAPLAGLSSDGVAGVGGFTVKTAVRETPSAVAEIVAAVTDETELVVTEKDLLVLPAVTVTLAGTLAAAESSDRVTTVPPDGATALSVTVPVEVLPPVTLDGLSVNEDGGAAAAGAAATTPSSTILTRVTTARARIDHSKIGPVNRT
jgi:hypothetical protein